MNYKSWYNKKYTPEQIKEIQRFLELDADGIVGDKTIAAVKDYQDAYGLTADGLWGKDTQAKADEWNKKWEEFTPTGKYSKVDENEELYKEYAKNLNKKYELEEREKYESNFAPNVEMSNVELAYLDKEIDKVKKQLEDRQANYESVPTPKTQVGWASYIANNDRGLLDKYQDAERAWYNKMKDQEHAKELANVQRREQRAINLNDARDTLAKLQIMKDNAVQQGHDTRDIDVQIASIYRDYPELASKEVVTKDYDPRSAVEYVLADIEDIDDNNTQEEINEAINKVSKYNTPESIKALNKLDKALIKRQKKEESQEKYKSEVDNWTNGGDITKYLSNLGMEIQLAGDKERLVNKKTDKIIAERPIKKKATTSSTNTTPSNHSWEI